MRDDSCFQRDHRAGFYKTGAAERNASGNGKGVCGYYPAEFLVYHTVFGLYDDSEADHHRRTGLYAGNSGKRESFAAAFRDFRVVRACGS